MSRGQFIINTPAALAIVGLGLMAGVLSPRGDAPGRALNKGTDRKTRSASDGRGRHAERPTEIPVPGLRDVFWRTVNSVSDDNVTFVAAGVTFYLLLALFPALAAVVSLYGLLADPADISAHIRDMSGVLPPGAIQILSDQLQSLVQNRNTTLGFAFLGGLAIALWSAHNGTLAIFQAMNVAYDEKEKRGFIRLNLVALAFTLGTMVSAALMIGALALLPVITSHLSLTPLKESLTLLARWPFLLAMMFLALTAIYRFGPSREPAKVRWITWGATLATFAWLLMTLGFSWYLDNFANYNATYGALGGLIGFMVWMWLSVAVLIVGAEVNAELEHQTERDSTTGPPQPIGERGAFVADDIGKPVD